MKKHGWIIFLTVVVVSLLVLYTVGYSVSYREIAFVKTFGKAGAVISGPEGRDGFHWKLPYPIQRLVRYDARTHIFEDTHDELTTSDQHNILVTVFCWWRIQDPVKFWQWTESGSVSMAEERLRSILRSIKGAVVGQRLLADFVNTDPGRMRIAEIEQTMLDRLRADADAGGYGVNIEMVGIKALGLSQEVTKKVVQGMEEERNKYVKQYQQEGDSEAMRIRSRAETSRDQILEFARTLASQISTQGDQEAARYLKQYDQNKALAMYLLELEALKEVLKKNSVVLIDTQLLRSLGFFKDAPTLPRVASPTTLPAVTGLKAN